MLHQLPLSTYFWKSAKNAHVASKSLLVLAVPVVWLQPAVDGKAPYPCQEYSLALAFPTLPVALLSA